MASTAATVASLHKIAEGREAEIFAWGDHAVLRLLREPGGMPRLAREAAAMAAARAVGVAVPEPRGFATVDGRPGLIMERVTGEDLLTQIGRRPWTVFTGARATGRLHAAVNRTVAPPSLPALREDLARRIARVELPEHLRTFALEQLAALPDGDRLCHGDFHPGNVLAGKRGAVIIDWPNVTRGDPDADLARTLLMLALGDPPPGAPLLIAKFVDVARGLFESGYRRAYIAARTPDWDSVRRWQVVRAADRLADGIEVERPKLLRRLDAAYAERDAR
jgi:aminoglycoside phosphotransferase (APT) family kinase protein